MAAKHGSLSINSDNILPIIKKWLYSDHDIFAREMVSNGCDAITKLKKLEVMGEYDFPDDYKPMVRVIVNPEEKTYEYNGKMIKPTLIKSDMDIEMRIRAYELAFESLSKYVAEKEMSEFIKANFDREFEPEWQCVIGKDFESAFDRLLSIPNTWVNEHRFYIKKMN